MKKYYYELNKSHNEIKISQYELNRIHYEINKMNS